MYLFECTQNVMPCPLEFQQRALILTTENLQALGITTESISKALGFGFSVIMAFGLSGYMVGVVKKLIGQL